MSYKLRIYYEDAVCPDCRSRLGVKLLGDFVLRSCKTCMFQRVEIPRTSYDPPTEREFYDKNPGMAVRLIRSDVHPAGDKKEAERG